MKIASKAALVGAAVLSSIAVGYASYPGYYPAPSGPSRGPQTGGQQGVKLHRASANHSCWSAEVIGYSCYVSGVGYTDCTSAQMSLSMQDCCGSYYHQGKRVTSGRSMGLTNFSCTTW